MSQESRPPNAESGERGADGANAAGVGNWDRQVIAPGAVNLRDFGGYRTGGGRLRRGLLYRGGYMTHITGLGAQLWERLGITLICDLRRPDERGEYPTPFDVPIVEVSIDPGNAQNLRAALARGDADSVAERRSFMQGINVDLVRNHAADFRRVFEALLGLDDGAFLVHCTAGKDRTGVACALILAALEVPEDTIFADYLLTNAALDDQGRLLPRLPLRRPADAAAVRALEGVHESYLRAAFDTMAADHGGVDGYLRDAVGLGDIELDALRRRYVE
ncbi:MAG: tyrosine-protein phosphatase [Pseudomonadota bacterium]